MKNWKLLLAAICIAGFTSCAGGGEGDGEVTTTDTLSLDITPETENHNHGKVIAEKNGLKLTSVEDSPDFPNATLKITSPTDGDVLKAGPKTFSYEISNYELGAQTGGAHTEHCANSGQGQHIHLILNNAPYTAHYEPSFSQDLKDGHHVALSFLSRSYHESVKNGTAYQLIQFNVGTTKTDKVDLTQPLMFYSRPKGEYKGPKETDRLLLDFFLANVDLSENGHKVRATINGTDFLLTKWEPVFIEGLPLGDVTIKLELLDKDNNLVNAPYNPVERTVKLMAAE